MRVPQPLPAPPRPFTSNGLDNTQPNPTHIHPGRAQILTFVTQVLSIRYELDEVFSTPDRIVARARAVGQAVAAVHGAQLAGRPYTMPTVHVFRTEGNRLAEHWGVRDELGVLVQIGALPAPSIPAPAVPAPAS